ncbi:hypothetical protein PC117_g13058 [Phytophthora cactorum]|uniref:Uncharacterized protein n=2 Tax=Phytophthora cactorum TaxID=29920 RepID=A0A8T1D3H7_9STRA|nr:hypothetical protein PC117_g13058 [Phytophthora cactorum]
MSPQQLAAFFYIVVEPEFYRIPLTAREYAEFQRRNLTSLEVFVFVDEVTTHMYDWLRWIVERNLLLCEVENQLTRQLVRLKPTSVGTLKTYMHRVADRVGNTIAKEMGECFGIMFDRWSSGTRHFVAVFVVYHDLVFIVADNCTTNRSVAAKLDVPLIGCASHRFNLAMVRFLSDSENLINMIQRLMASLRQPNNAAQLALHTALLPEKANATRWSSVWKMVHKYVRIRDAAKHVPAVEELLPRLSDHRRILVLHDKLKELQ